MDDLVRPKWLRKGELRDPVWEMHLQDPNTHTESSLVIDFNQILTGWPNVRSLLDPEFERDLITIKLVIFYSLDDTVGWNDAPGSVKRTFASHVDFVRWRHDNGLSMNSALSNAWFNKFDDVFKRSHREGLLNLLPKARALLHAHEAGDVVLPRTATGLVSTNEFAQLLGISNGSQLTVAARMLSEAHFAAKGTVFSRAHAERKEPLVLAKEITTETAFRHYKVWLDLYDLSKYLKHDPIGHRAFKSKRELRKWLKSWVKVPKPTPDAPVYQASCLIDQSLKLVLETVIDDAVDLIEDGVDSKNRIRNVEKLAKVNGKLRALGFPEIGPYYYQDGHLPKPGEPVFLYFFVFVVALVAARVVTAAFSARRDEEVASTLLDCIEHDAAGDVWLRCLIVKNLDRVDRIPVPKSVARAVDIVKRIRSLGNKPGNKLYDFACPINERNVRFELDLRLDQARDYLNIPLLDDGSAWHFTPHQFRKFFGVVYFWRWAFPNLTALTLQYRHFNPDVTKGYIELRAADALRLRDEKLAEAARKSDALRTADFDSGRVEFVSWTIKGISTGLEIGGPLGRRLRAEIDALKEQFLPDIQITESLGDADEPTLDAALEALIGTTLIKIHPEGHSLCGCGGSERDVALSQCLALKQMLTGILPSEANAADFDFAEDTGCLVCPHRGALPTMSEYWDQEMTAIQKSILLAPPKQKADLSNRMATIQEFA
ncbi:hypothetical protein [Rhizobium leguminosarum]|uniref:hypothetical protein n=1 Tax=Rhizobium leguminosarum TaxID=384 RepID=UPI0015F7A3F7|nr:hypothetical protein [Rhizobium leguminosarum]MBA9030932.1 hypothetical protein [Rhizobium leguminosarum]